MPFCALREPVQAGEVRVIPVRRGEAAPAEVSDVINGLLDSYRDVWGNPIRAANVLSLRGRFRHAPKTWEDDDLLAEMVDLVAFASMSEREVFSPQGRYSNYACFATFGAPVMRAGRVPAITVRRRATLKRLAGGDFFLTVPEQCDHMDRVGVDTAVLDALLRWRAAAPKKDWARWLNAIQCFNQGNSDSDTMRDQVEWVLHASAFERILNAASEANDVAEKFCRLIVPGTETMFKDSARAALKPMSDKSVRFEWIREFYRLRGSFAHGNLAAEPQIWSLAEHLALASWAFPLIVRVLLKGLGGLAETYLTRKEINRFEKFAEIDFASPVPDPRSSGDCHWARVMQ
jgi:hypothetical protein